MPIVIGPLPAWAQGAEVTCLESLQNCYPVPPGLHTQVILGLHGGNKCRQGGRVLRDRRSPASGSQSPGRPSQSRLIPPKSSNRRSGLAPRCRLVTSWGWRRSQGLGCSPIKVARELGSERRETVRSLSIVGAGVLRGADTSTRGPCWTDLRFTGCTARCTAGYPRLDWISAESI